MASGKYQVISAVLKQDKPFKAVKITDATAMSRQLVFKHLNNLVIDGYIQKDGMYYTLINRDALVDRLIESTENVGPKLLDKQRGFIGKIELINRAVETVALYRNAKLEGNNELTIGLQQGIDETIKDLKQLRRYLFGKQIEEKSAAKKLYRDWEERWKLIGNEIQKAGFTQAHIYTQLEKKVSE